MEFSINLGKPTSLNIHVSAINTMPMTSAKDTIFKDENFESSGFPRSDSGDAHFAFNSKVAAVFDDMVSRSVPSYLEIQEITAKLASLYVKDNTSVYDLGCSTGTSLIRIAQAIPDIEKRGISLLGIDYSNDMLERCREKLRAFSLDSRITLYSQDLRNVTIHSAALVICHYTLQFLPPEDRPEIIRRVKEGMIDGGIFILSEKINHTDPVLEEFLTARYYDFKKGNGYTDQENFRKRQALENVLRTLSIDENMEMLRNAGFRSVEIINKSLSFVSILATR